MKKSKAIRRPTTEPARVAPVPAGASQLLQIALIVAISVVIAKSTMMESLRDPFGITPNAAPYPRGQGPASGLVLDLLACVPALLVCIHRVLQKRPIVRKSLACWLGGGFAIWALASTFWSDDKFAALVNASHLAAAICLLWSASQSVTTWKRFRLVAAMAFGLLLVNLTQACVYKFIDLPDLQKGFELQKSAFLSQRGWKEGEFIEKQFEDKIKNGELLGFTSSSNSCAAVLVMLMGVSLGLVIQRMADEDRFAAVWAGVIGLGIAAGIGVLFWTLCKAAIVTSVFILVVMLVVWKRRGSLARRPALGFWAGATLVILGALSAVAFGLTFHRLPGASLNFRWRYWVAAWQVFLDHPLLGVGWSNFGAHYLRHRLPIAAEEIQDTHDFVLKFLTELGIIGVILGLAWLARLWWEMARPFPSRTDHPAENEFLGIGSILLLGIAGLTLNSLASVDLSEPGPFILMELVRRGLFALVLIFGSSIAAMKSLSQSHLDERPAPWVLYAMLAALGSFFLHNTIEFSLFETGPLMLAMLLAGSILGMRRRESQSSRAVGITQSVLTFAAITAAFFGVVLPTVQSESFAQRGDDELRSKQFSDAVFDYRQAFDTDWSLNADYIYRAALASGYQPGDPNTTRGYLDQAIATDPSMVLYWLSRGRLDLRMDDAQAMSTDFEKALDLNPNEVSIRLEFAAGLMHFGRSEEAARQCDLARHYNDLLPREEPKRLTDAALQKEIDSILQKSG